ncbi:MAG: RluA family pseudouridine synthase [Bacilli bacterium]|nr:RluA family pseudouridine synthase [Bacilli bacterium]
MNNLEILYEDNHVIVVFKPINILSQSDITGDIDMLSLIKKYLKEKYHKPGNVYLGLVHRLDRVTSGVMVFAKTSKAASRLSESIRKKEFKKDYLAIIHGRVSNGQYEDYLLKKDDFSTVVSKEGKLAILNFNLLEYNKDKDISLVNVHLETGRHHQIRVQFASRNHPLLGDKRYGNDSYDTLGLCAYHLEFIHPVTKELMSFTRYPKGNIWNFKWLKENL